MNMPSKVIFGDNLFIPNFPEISKSEVSIFEAIKKLKENPLKVWSRKYYQEKIVIDKGFWSEKIFIISDPDVVREVLMRDEKEVGYSRLRQALLKPVLGESILTGSGVNWLKIKKSVAPFFTEKKIKGEANKVLQVCEAVSEQELKAGKVIDLSVLIAEMSVAIASETVFSGQLTADRKEFAAKLNHLFINVGEVDILDLIHVPTWVPRASSLRLKPTKKYFSQCADKMIDNRTARLQKEQNDANDLLGLLVNGMTKGELTRQEVKDHILAFICSSIDTVALSVTWFLYLMSCNHYWRSLVEKEAKVFTQSEKDIGERLSAMSYTRAALDETMRLYPPVPTIARAANAGFKAGELKIPKGAQLWISTWLMHRHEKLWDEPNTFNPSRFLPDNKKSLHKFQFLPFAAGAHTCIGSKVGINVSLMMIATLMSKYRFEMSSEHAHPMPAEKITTKPINGCYMCPSMIQ